MCALRMDHLWSLRRLRLLTVLLLGFMHGIGAVPGPARPSVNGEESRG